MLWGDRLNVTGWPSQLWWSFRLHSEHAAFSLSAFLSVLSADAASAAVASIVFIFSVCFVCFWSLEIYAVFFSAHSTHLRSIWRGRHWKYCCFCLSVSARHWTLAQNTVIGDLIADAHCPFDSLARFSQTVCVCVTLLDGQQQQQHSIPLLCD